jgi:hypothetical protein
MKILRLEKGEPAYVIIPVGSTLSVEETGTEQKGYKFILVVSH